MRLNQIPLDHGFAMPPKLPVSYTIMPVYYSVEGQTYAKADAAFDAINKLLSEGAHVSMSFSIFFEES